MTRSDFLLAWCWVTSFGGYIATVMAFMNSEGAVGTALASACGIYVGHFFVKRSNDNKLSSIVNKLDARARFHRGLNVASAVLAIISAVAVVYYLVRWEDRAFFPSLNALLVSPLAYYGFACGKFILRRSRAP